MNTTIIIPAYNEALRLPSTLEALRECISSRAMAPLVITEVIVVDDGSTDATIDVAHSVGQPLPGFKVIQSGQNYGKGHAIRLGLLAARQEWSLIADADMSTPWGEGAKLARATQEKTAQVAIASRDLAQSDIRIKQSWVRETMGKTFNTIVRVMTGLSFKDTQCGFKLFSSTAIRPFVSKLEVNRFAWDVEFLLFAQRAGLQIAEVPVTWEHREQSRVHPIVDGFNMLFTVIGLRFKMAREKK